MAAQAMQEGNGKKLDANHSYRVSNFTDFKKYADVPDVYEPPKRSEHDQSQGLLGWLLDSRDQFVVRHGRDTQIFWNDPVRKYGQEQGRELKYGGEKERARGKVWTELYVQWSPKGTYLATFHHQGIALWGGDGFEKLQRFSHNAVKWIDWSPCERYVVTCNDMDAKKKTDQEVSGWCFELCCYHYFLSSRFNFYYVLIFLLVVFHPFFVIFRFFPYESCHLFVCVFCQLFLPRELVES
jgi:hypothetical protein